MGEACTCDRQPVNGNPDSDSCLRERSFMLCCRRLIEVLTGSWSLSGELRVPAISRLQKIHNVSVVLGELARRGVVPDWKGCLHYVYHEQIVASVVLICDV